MGEHHCDVHEEDGCGYVQHCYHPWLKCDHPHWAPGLEYCCWCGDVFHRPEGEGDRKHGPELHDENVGE